MCYQADIVSSTTSRTAAWVASYISIGAGTSKMTLYVIGQCSLLVAAGRPITKKISILARSAWVGNSRRDGVQDCPRQPCKPPGCPVLELHCQNRGVIDDDAKECLHGELRWVRQSVAEKIDDLLQYQVRRPMTATGTNTPGLIKHLMMKRLG